MRALPFIQLLAGAGGADAHVAAGEGQRKNSRLELWAVALARVPPRAMLLLVLVEAVVGDGGSGRGLQGVIGETEAAGAEHHEYLQLLDRG
jgi:hypothetical protein